MNKSIILVLALVAISFQFVSAQGPPLESTSEIKNRAFKIDPFSPMSGKLTFGYEQNVHKGINIDVDASIIGPSVSGIGELNAVGFYLKGGPRLYTSPDYYTDDLKRFSDFQGFYLMPTIGYTWFTFSENDPFDVLDENIDRVQNAGTIMFNLGKQWVMGGIAVIDFNAGLGYGFTTNNDINYNYSHVGNTITVSSSLSIGLLTR